MRLLDLPWLIRPPEDFRSQVKHIRVGGPDTLLLARRLSTFGLDITQLRTLGTAITPMLAARESSIRLGVISNGTSDLSLPALTVSALRHGVELQALGTSFDQVAPEALDPGSNINKARCHFVLLALDHRGLPLTIAPGNMELAQQAVVTALRYTETLCNGLKDASGCTVIVQTLPQVNGSLLGSLERALPGTLQWLIDHYNKELRRRISHSSDLLLDTAALAEMLGSLNWHNPMQWNLGKFPFSLEIVPLYADWVARLLAAARGKSRKCLVLDLDNTVWGGVIGDDGLAGIVLGNGSPEGEAFLNVQATALALRARGIALAISSKNDDALARGPFRSHPEMLLKEEHITVFQANWRDKASNLQAIARTLNIGTEGLVLLDDNPVERAQVRAALPDVAVPELPAEPALYAQTLLAAGYFEATTFTVEDRLRGDLYRANAERAEWVESTTNLESHLRSLQMRAHCGPFDAPGRARITQLINKTNQFNLTTRRYTVAEVEKFETAQHGMTLQVRLADRFGDNGMIAVVICVPDRSDWIIDTWVMSCRVLNRQVERATLDYIVRRAREANVSAILGQYLQTDRNSIVADHYERLGFTPYSKDHGLTWWKLDVASYESIPIPIVIVDSTAAIWPTYQGRFNHG